MISVSIRQAQVADLTDINSIISACVMDWDLPERVKRLSIGTYQYNGFDLKHLDIIVAEDSGSQVVGVAALENADPSDIPGGKAGLLLHGLYIAPVLQKHGVGKQLLEFAFQKVKRKAFNGLLVKAQVDANSYFQKQSFEHLPVIDSNKDYPHRWWKQL